MNVFAELECLVEWAVNNEVLILLPCVFVSRTLRQFV